MGIRICWAGTRTAKITDGVLTYYLVDTGGVLSQVLAELDHTGALITYYTRGSEIISISRPGEKHYYLNDGHGSVRALSDTDGQVTDTYLYDAFGNLLSKTGTTANDFLYTGEQYDANTGFYYLRARYMNPSTGTFTSPDAYAGTIFDPVSLHKYLYANANPVMNRDPSGYSTFTLTEMEASIVISGIIGAAMNSIPKGIMRLVSGEPMDDMFWFTFASDFIVGFECGMAFAAIGFLATQFLLLSCLVKSILFTMGLKFSFDCIGDLWHGNYGSAILNAIGAAFCFFGASGFNYKGSGLGLGGFADDAANLADDAANVVDDATNLASDPRTNHILYGDETGGGHLWPGQPGKTPFPQNWDANTIMRNISDIVTDPSLTWNPGRIVNGIQRYEVIGIRDGIKIKVITDGTDIITAYPLY